MFKPGSVSLHHLPAQAQTDMGKSIRSLLAGKGTTRGEFAVAGCRALPVDTQPSATGQEGTSPKAARAKYWKGRLCRQASTVARRVSLA